MALSRISPSARVLASVRLQLQEEIAFFSLELRKMLYVRIDKSHKIDAKTKSLDRAFFSCPNWETLKTTE